MQRKTKSLKTLVAACQSRRLFQLEASAWALRQHSLTRPHVKFGPQAEEEQESLTPLGGGTLGISVVEDVRDVAGM